MTKLPVQIPENGTEAWTQHELDLLHRMVRDYDRATWLKGQIRWWLIWAIGLPTALLTMWKAVEELANKFGWRI